jgi:diguanylate cyclase (GGDEF)-like protein
MLKYNEFSDFLTKSLDFNHILSGTLDKLEELTDSVSGIIYEAAEIDGRSRLIPKKYYGIRKFVAKEFDTDEGVVGECLTKKKIIWFHDIPENAILLKEQLLSDGANGKTIDYGFCEVFPKDIVWLPLYIESSSNISIPLGVIMLSSLKGFKKEDIGFLEHAAKELSITLDNARMHQKLSILSITDELTGLYNRRYLNEFLEREFNLAKRHNTKLSLLMMDIDDFKHLNDFYGHQLGDEVLRTVGQIINDNIRATDLGARYGGEEFTIVLPQTGFEGSFEVAKKIKEQLSKFQFKGLVENITISVGIANYPECEGFNHFNHINKSATETETVAADNNDSALKTGTLLNNGNALKSGSSGDFYNAALRSNDLGSADNIAKINTIDNLIKIADNYLYEAKSNGKNRIAGSNCGKKIIFK